MTSIVSALPTFVQPASVQAQPPALLPAPADTDDSSTQSAEANVPTNADDTTQTSYTAVASTSTSNIRGTNLNISA